MNDQQWLFEAYALRKADERDMHLRMESMKWQRNLLVNLLGLNLVKEAGGDGDEYIPLAVLCGQPDVMKYVFEEREREEKAGDALNDPDFDEWSEKLARGEDLLPMPEEEVLQFGRSPRIVFDEEEET
jgi:hypothetical protein